MTDIPTNSSRVERIVMQRVYLIHALRFAISGSALSMFVSALALWGIGRQVWVAQVLQNAPPSPLDFIRFYLFALAHTSFTVQILVLLVLISFLYLARELYRAIAVVRAPYGL